MTAEPMTDLTGDVVLELRAATPTWPGDFVNCPVDSGTIAKDHTPKDGTAPLLCVVRRSPITRHRRLPLQFALFTIDCYGRTKPEASILAGLVSAWFHDRGPRTRARRIVWSSADIGQSGSLTEPGTNWPLERVTVQVTGGTQVLP